VHPLDASCARRPGGCPGGRPPASGTRPTGQRRVRPGHRSALRHPRGCTVAGGDRARPPHAGSASRPDRQGSGRDVASAGRSDRVRAMPHRPHQPVPAGRPGRAHAPFPVGRGATGCPGAPSARSRLRAVMGDRSSVPDHQPGPDATRSKLIASPRADSVHSDRRPAPFPATAASGGGRGDAPVGTTGSDERDFEQRGRQQACQRGLQRGLQRQTQPRQAQERHR